MEYSGDDYYCDVVFNHVVPVRVVFESDTVLAFHHTKPYCPVHIVVVPKKHIDSLNSVTDDDRAILLELIKVIQKISTDMVQQYGAARVLTNLGTYQDSKHLHFHISFGEPLKKNV